MSLKLNNNERFRSEISPAQQRKVENDRAEFSARCRKLSFVPNIYDIPEVKLVKRATTQYKSLPQPMYPLNDIPNQRIIR
jgi:hypothetical protein